MSPSNIAPFPDLTQPRFDQSTYSGRVRHFIDVTDPRTLFASHDELYRAKSLIDDFKNGIIHPDISIDQYWKAKKLVSASFHPDTGDLILLPFRMSSSVPTNMVVLLGMLNWSATPFSIIFWQWLNQSINVGVNYANANKTTPMSMNETAIAYAGAVSASCTVALGLNRFAKNGRLPLPMVRCIPFTAVAIAGVVNVFLMRQKELRQGISVKDKLGNDLGQSPQAGWRAVSQVAMCRVVAAAPCLLIPPLVMARLKPRISNPRLLLPIELAVVAGSLVSTLPFAIALFPQQGKVHVSSLEDRFQALHDKNGNSIEHVYYNKGL